MGHAKEALEHSEHIAHAGHDHGADRLSTRIGITIAVLGVFLAVAGAKVGGERTELIGTMVEQEHAHAEFQMQNIKHRMTVLVLRQVHAELPKAEAAKELDGRLSQLEAQAEAPEAAAAIEAARALGASVLQTVTPRKEDTLMLARLVDRYFAEQEAAQKWVEEFEPKVKAHSEAQERYELGQLSAEFGVVVCSLALLFRSRLAWGTSIFLGLASLGIVIVTFMHTAGEVKHAQAHIEEARKVYEEKHVLGKTRPLDKAMVEDVLAYYGAPPSPPAPESKPAAAKHH